jgi:hypothetical protein
LIDAMLPAKKKEVHINLEVAQTPHNPRGCTNST